MRGRGRAGTFQAGAGVGPAALRRRVRLHPTDGPRKLPKRGDRAPASPTDRARSKLLQASERASTGTSRSQPKGRKIIPEIFSCAAAVIPRGSFLATPLHSRLALRTRSRRGGLLRGEGCGTGSGQCCGGGVSPVRRWSRPRPVRPGGDSERNGRADAGRVWIRSGNRHYRNRAALLRGRVRRCYGDECCGAKASCPCCCCSLGRSAVGWLQ